MSKYNYKRKRNDYKTPPVLYQMALDYWGIDFFDVDTCCSDTHIPATIYCINGKIDGLTFPWQEFNWCNPPFNECAKWIKKACDEQQKGNKTAMLIPVRAETKYWHEYILNNPKIDLNKHIIWLKKGYKFLNRDNAEMGVFKNALCIVFFE